MSNTFEDIAANAGSLLVIGSNVTEQHPVFGARLRQAILRRKLKLVVASPDFINIAEYAALALYHHPNTETALVNGLMHIILEKGWQNQAAIDRQAGGGQADEFADFREVIERYTPARTAEITGVSAEALYQAAEILAHNPPLAAIWSSGLADPLTGRSSVLSLASLQRLLGSLDVPGGGVNPLRPQNNSQGASDMGAMPGYLPGYQPLSDEAARRKFEQAWGVELPAWHGLTAAEMVEAAGGGRLQALYVVGEELLNTSPEAAGVRRSLEACPFLVVQEIESSDTARYADVLLPGVSFAEKSGVFTSSERRIQRVQQALQPIGGARPDWQIIAELARRLLSGGERRPTPAPHAGWEYAGTAQVLDEIAALTPIYAGLSQARLASGEPVYWPVGAESLLLPVGYFSEGRARWLVGEEALAR
jgi:predicted molibdopterin-dependent oxidoreductase YjgC